MRVTFTLPAPADSRYGADAFAHQVGREIVLTVLGPVTGTAVLAGALVHPGGASADVTVEVGEDSELGRAVTEAAGGRAGHLHVHEDGSVSP